MAKFHSVNKTMTLGTFLFIASLVVLVIEDIFHSNQTVLAYAFLYGGLVFLVSVVLIFVGVQFGAKSGKLQKRGSKNKGHRYEYKDYLIVFCLGDK